MKMGTKIKILLFILCIFGLYVFIEERTLSKYTAVFGMS